uniref:(northern house mosquito) hypothetical protein n=1 Tax=Culex pipiens TaxID=7175 RepID=A0A8D8FET4_CULPI
MFLKSNHSKTHQRKVAHTLWLRSCRQQTGRFEERPNVRAPCPRQRRTRSRWTVQRRRNRRSNRRDLRTTTTTGQRHPTCNSKLDRLRWPPWTGTLRRRRRPTQTTTSISSAAVAAGSNSAAARATTTLPQY